MSVASIWEVAIKAAKGKLDLPDDLDDVRARPAPAQPLVAAADRASARAARGRAFRMIHADPFDRVLVAQAQVEGIAAHHGRPGHHPLRRRDDLVTDREAPRPEAKPRPKKRKFSDPGAELREAARALPAGPRHLRPRRAGRTVRAARPGSARLDPTSELILTILTQNSADTNAEVAFEALRRPTRRAGRRRSTPGAGWGGIGLPPGAPPDWAAVEFAPIQELTDVIRPGGLANQKAPRLQATLRRIREERGDYSLEFLGEMPALEARAWLTSIDGIGKKTASVVLLFCFGLPLMPVDRHVERVSQRVGPHAREGDRRRRPRPLPWRASSRTRCTRPTST